MLYSCSKWWRRNLQQTANCICWPHLHMTTIQSGLLNSVPIAFAISSCTWLLICGMSVFKLYAPSHTLINLVCCNGLQAAYSNQDKVCKASPCTNSVMHCTVLVNSANMYRYNRVKTGNHHETPSPTLSLRLDWLFAAHGLLARLGLCQ